MKLGNCSLPFFTMFLLGTASLVGGCATTGMDRASSTSDSIQDVDSEMRKMVVQVDLTSASLESLVMPGQSDLEKAFGAYSDNVSKLEKEGNRAIKRLDEMKLNSKEYFAEWEKQGIAYKNPQIRELSEERRLKLSEIYARIPAAGAGVKVSYLAAMSDLKEIRIYLSNDLTPRGIETITPVATKTIQDLESLKASLHPVISALDEMKPELYGGK
ncbi:MAG: DUF2959 family protein [Desulfuromonadaceae bacterium]|nr:DUF2959 family protein [Desulfuromonadaceae bacterium]